MAQPENLGTSEISEKIYAGQNHVHRVWVTSGTYAIGAVVTGAKANSTGAAGDVRAVVSLEAKTLSADGYIDAIVSGQVQRGGLTNLTDALESSLFASGIFVV